MSAFVVGKEHINAMVTAGLRVNYRPLSWYHNTRSHQLTDETADAVGQMLLDENVRSVGYRYEGDSITDLPGKINAEWLIPFKYQPTIDCPTGIETIKITRCYEYQSCEHQEWEQSEAKAFCKALIASQYGRLPGYEEAPWEWERPIQAIQGIRLVMKEL